MRVPSGMLSSSSGMDSSCGISASTTALLKRLFSWILPDRETMFPSSSLSTATKSAYVVPARLMQSSTAALSAPVIRLVARLTAMVRITGRSWQDRGRKNSRISPPTAASGAAARGILPRRLSRSAPR